MRRRDICSPTACGESRIDARAKQCRARGKSHEETVEDRCICSPWRRACSCSGDRGAIHCEVEDTEFRRSHNVVSVRRRDEENRTGVVNEESERCHGLFRLSHVISRFFPGAPRLLASTSHRASTIVCFSWQRLFAVSACS